MPSKRIHFEDGVGRSEEGEAEEAEEEIEEPEFLSTEEASDLRGRVRMTSAVGGSTKNQTFKG